MRVIILRTRTNQRAFVVVIVLISKIPIQPPIDPNREPAFGRLKIHRVGIYQDAWCSSRIGKTIALPVILIDSVRCIESYPRKEPRRRVEEEEIVSHEVQRVAERMPDAVVEIVDNGVAVHPVIVVARTKREPGIGVPIN